MAERDELADKDVAPDIAEDGAVIPSRAATDEGDAASDDAAADEGAEESDPATQQPQEVTTE